jgi:hypothetical protein
MHDVPPPNIRSTDPTVESEQMVSDYMTDLLTRLKSESARNQLQLVQELAGSGEAGLDALMNFLLERRSEPVGVIDGKVYQVLAGVNSPKVQDFLQTHFPQGIVPLHSDRGIDYAPLQALLVQQNFQDADRLTLEKLCELAGATAVQRKWLYFTEVEQFPTVDLQTVNLLWRTHSEGRFGYSVQREIWLSTGKNWDKLWSQIGWRAGNNWTRYPQEFTWGLDAPRGHLPLSNQLRGVRVMSALLNHPAWVTE